ncbi:MAG: hypothetical protein E7410_05650 [Ruminococcaceae bacterium]|nr:hypothetical protein [Oscillospiraceae bacterium]
MDKIFSIANMMPIIDELVGQGKSVEIMPHGESMLPTIKAGDTVTVSSADSGIKKYDVALYTRTDGSAILHRVCAVLDDGYAMAGDAQSYLEYPVKREQIVAVVTKVVRDGKVMYEREKRNILMLFFRDIRLWRAEFLLYAYPFYKKYIRKYIRRTKG